jgi:hypothetical protein
MLASFGLAVNLFLWGIPGLVAAAGAAHLVAPTSTPTLAETLQSLESHSSATPGLEDALIKLIGAESEALQVAGDALQQPTPTDIAPRANAAGAHVEDAAATYVRAAQALLQR